jgi:hypothetical protein
MKLTVEEVAKLTKLSVATIRLHAAKKKLGTKEGNRRYFSRKDVDEIKGSSSSGSAAKRPAGKKPADRKPAGKKPLRKPPAGRKLSAPPVVETKARQVAKPEPRPEKRSFWSIFSPRPRQKISLLEAKIKK